MHRIFLAFRVLFLVLFDGSVAQKVEQALGEAAETGPKLEEPAETRPAKPPEPARPARSEALTLLATLQREARLVDFVKEPLGDYSDAQVGAAVRDIHRDCAKVLDRLFALQPVVDEQENADVEVPSGFDAGRFRLTGNVAGDPPFHGKLVHHGWEATACELPTWTGSEGSAHVVAPAEVELR